MGERGTLLEDTSRRADIRLMRVIKCLRLLEHSCYSAERLADHFFVSKRTVYRDLRALVLAGVPVARSKRGEENGYHVPTEPSPNSLAALAAAQGRHYGTQPTAPGPSHHNTSADRSHL